MEIFQGETVSFAVRPETEGESLVEYAVSAALRPIRSAFLRDCHCDNTIIQWAESEVDAIDEAAVWELTSSQSASLPAGRYAIEIALRDKQTGKVAKQISKTEVLEVKRSYIR